MISRWDHVRLRGEDPEGSGAFAARRGGKRHKGVDYAFEPGEEVRSPVEGIVTRLGWCYDNDKFRLVEILSHKGYFLWRFLYVKPSVKAGQKVFLDTVLGTAQAISDRYGKEMTDHVHVEINLDPRAIIGGKDGD